MALGVSARLDGRLAWVSGSAGRRCAPVASKGSDGVDTELTNTQALERADRSDQFTSEDPRRPVVKLIAPTG